MPKIKVNGNELEVPPGKRLLEALVDSGTFVPHYCWHPGLTPAGNCRMCLVKVSTSRKLEVACMIMPSENLEVTTEGPEVDAGRKAVLEYMLINHPLDCPICDKAGECMLQDYTYNYRRGLSRFEEDKVIRHTKDLGRNIKIWGNRCISCTRCVRFCDEISGTGELTIVNRGDHSVADTHPNIELDNPMSLCTVDICPVGALIDKNFLYQARVWFAERKDSVCTGCSRGCNVTATVYKGEVKRLQPRLNTEVNGHWMCDAGRLNISHITSEQRLSTASTKGTVANIVQALRNASGQMGIIASTANTLEELYLIKQLATALKARVGFITKEEGARWVSKSGFAIETDKTSNRRGAELLFGAPLPSAYHVARAIPNGAVRSLLLFNQISDPDWTTTELDNTLQKLTFFGVASPYDSHLFRLAPVLLPTTCWAEKDGTIMNRDGRIQRIRTLVAPPAGSRSDCSLLQEILVALGVRKSVISAEGIFREAFPGLDYRILGDLGSMPSAGSQSAAPAAQPVSK